VGSQGSGHARVRPGCNQWRMNVILSLPLVRTLSGPSWLAVYSPTYSWDAEMLVDRPLMLCGRQNCYFGHAGGWLGRHLARHLQGKMSENGQRGSFHHRVGVTQDRRFCVWETAQIGPLSTGSLIGRLLLAARMAA
jgi:hypothetical protein